MPPRTTRTAAALAAIVAGGTAAFALRPAAATNATLAAHNPAEIRTVTIRRTIHIVRHQPGPAGPGISGAGGRRLSAKRAGVSTHASGSRKNGATAAAGAVATRASGSHGTAAAVASASAGGVTTRASGSHAGGSTSGPSASTPVAARRSHAGAAAHADRVCAVVGRRRSRLAQPGPGCSPGAATGSAGSARLLATDCDRRRTGDDRAPPGLMIDTGGTGKDLCADAVAYRLGAYSRFVVDCGGDIAIGGIGTELEPYRVEVEHPLTGRSVGSFLVMRGGVATSGLNVRIWRDRRGRFAHHLLDPSTGSPAWTGLIAATAVGSTALEAETLSKTALLLGPDGAREVLAERGGVIVHDGGEVEPVGPIELAGGAAVPAMIER